MIDPFIEGFAVGAMFGAFGVVAFIAINEWLARLRMPPDRRPDLPPGHPRYRHPQRHIPPEFP